MLLNRLTQQKNIMVSANTRKGCYISILNIIQGAVDPTQVSFFASLHILYELEICLTHCVYLIHLNNESYEYYYAYDI